MALSTGRTMTDEDWATLNARATAFAARHGLTLDDDAPPVPALEAALYAMRDADASRAAHLERLWERVHERATGYPHHGYGVLGTHA